MRDLFNYQKMIQPIIYTAIEQKNKIEREKITFSSEHDCLIQALDYIDLMIALRGKKHIKPTVDETHWIVLNYKNDK
jgi:hypothetical protein